MGREGEDGIYKLPEIGRENKANPSLEALGQAWPC